MRVLSDCETVEWVEQQGHSWPRMREILDQEATDAMPAACVKAATQSNGGDVNVEAVRSALMDRENAMMGALLASAKLGCPKVMPCSPSLFRHFLFLPCKCLV